MQTQNPPSAKIALSDRQRAVLDAIGRKDFVNQAYVQVVTGEQDWTETFDIIKGLRTLGLVELVMAGTGLRASEAGRALLAGGAK